MKKNKEVLKPEICPGGEEKNIERGASKGRAIRAWGELLKLNPDNDRATMVKQEIQTMKLALSKK